MKKFSNGETLDIGNFHGLILGYENKLYKYKCLKCGDEDYKAGNLISKGIGCSCCSNRKVVKGINDIPTTAPWMIDFFQGGEEEASLYTKSSGKYITPKCPYCQRILKSQKINNIYNHKGVSCVCKDGISFPNKIIYFTMEQLLENKQIKIFNREYHIKDDKNRFFDIYFQTNVGKEYFIEMDGGIGHGEVIVKHNSKSTDDFNVYNSSIFANDAIKENISKSLGIHLIRIDCFYSDFEYIKQNIINSELSQIVDLNNIDWNKIEQLSYTNLMKIICLYKKDNPSLTIKEIAKEFKLYTGTIRNYLKLGNKLGWCQYDVKAEEHKSRVERKYYGQSCKVILINLKTNEEVIFESVSDFVRNNSKYFSIPLTKKVVSNRFNKGNNFIENYEDYNIYKLRRNCDGIRKSS